MNDQPERRTLKMHPRLLWDVIHRQAGTLGKAILEGVMNSVDAGGTFCDVKIDRDGFSVSDDGKGFASDEEITKFFETFGFPHDEGDAKYGRFRMGRGQMMAFGRNAWVTNVYRMDVDLKPQKNELGQDYALGYEFRKVADSAPGCSVKVDLYDKLTPSALDSVIREITEYVKYVSIPVRLNGKTVSTDPTKETWDEITPDAYIKRKAAGTLDVYNQGVLVCKLSSYSHGVSGVVVSKEALEVNFARNNVQSTCPRWKRIVRLMNEDTMAQAKKNTPLNDSQRDFFARQVSSNGITLSELNDARIVTDITGSHHPLSIFSKLDRFQDKVSIAARGDRVAEMAHTRRLGFFVTDECAARFGADSPAELVKVIVGIYENNGIHLSNLKPVKRDEFEKVISASHEPVADKELNKAERMAVKAIREGAKQLYRAGRWRDMRAGTDVFLKGKDHGSRRIGVGSSDTALAWTDGTGNIWVERRQLKAVKEGHRGMMRLSALLLHEYLHNEPSTGTHEHGVEFYNRFHDLAVHSDIITEAADCMLKSVLKDLRDQPQFVSQQMTRFEDNVAQAADLGIGSYSPSAEPADGDAIDTAPEAESFVPDVAEPERLAACDAPVAAAPSPAAASVKATRRPAAPDNQLRLTF